MAKTVLCVGLATVEITGAVPAYPVRLGDRQELSAFSLQGGGAAANVAAALAALGAKVRFGGVLAEDYLGGFAAASLVDAGIDLAHLVRRPKGVSPLAFSALDESTRQRAVFFSRGEGLELGRGEISVEALDGVDLLVVDGAYPDAQLELVEAAKKRGIQTLLSARAQFRRSAALVAAVHTAIASELFARELAPLVPKALEEILARGPTQAVVTLGEEGAVGQRQGDDPVRVDSFAAKVVDNGGAADAFHAAFAYLWLDGKSLRDCLQFASAAAALKCREYGSRAGLPRLSEIEKLLES